MSETNHDQNRAFNLGCDARLAGRPLDSCPYTWARENGDLRTYWRRGWMDVHEHWGKATPYPRAMLTSLPAVS